MTKPLLFIAMDNMSAHKVHNGVVCNWHLTEEKHGTYSRSNKHKQQPGDVQFLSQNCWSVDEQSFDEWIEDWLSFQEELLLKETTV